MVSDWLFDTPWWLLAVLVGVGAAIFVAGNRRQERPVMRMGLLLLLAGVALGAMSGSWTRTRRRPWRARAQLRAAINATGTACGRCSTHTTRRLHERDAIVKGGRDTAERIGLRMCGCSRSRQRRRRRWIRWTVEALSEQDASPGNTRRAGSSSTRTSGRVDADEHPAAETAS